ncbi:MAG TPA: peptide chain release factor N(5)-glutamine methyltransferase [Burkholderiales bacterium]|nr:peptide chain release factor N(5)-glutamine methyltransferase [Burkholderiales bacterium]
MRESGIDAREARLLLAAATGFSEASVLAFPERTLPADVQDRFRGFAARRRKGEPVAYILGRKEFYSLDLTVTPAVLIPRPETELLVDLVLARKPASVLDLGTGSGAIALALKRHLPGTRVVATDSSAAALEVAKRNAVRLNLDVELRHGGWFEPVAGERFEAIVANPPYVKAGDPHLAQLQFEPMLAIESGADGLDAMRVVVREAPAHLLPGGWLLVEHGMGQQEAVRSLLEAAGLETASGWPDLAGIPRVAGGRVKSPHGH